MGLRDRLKKRIGAALKKGAPTELARPESKAPRAAAPAPAASRRSQLLRGELSRPATQRPAEPAPIPAASPTTAPPALSPAAAPIAAPPTAAPPTAAPALERDPYTVRVQTPEGETLVFTLRAGEPVCDAADRAGVEIPSSCRSGGCLVCCGRLLEGEVEMGEQYVLEDEDIERGFRLLCCTELRSDAVFLSHQESEVGG